MSVAEGLAQEIERLEIENERLRAALETGNDLQQGYALLMKQFEALRKENDRLITENSRFHVTLINAASQFKADGSVYMVSYIERALNETKTKQALGEQAKG